MSTRCHPRRLLALHFALAIVGVAWMAALPAAAVDRTHVLEWMMPEGPAADGFVVYLGAEPGVHTETLDLGFIGPDSDGIRRSNLVLDAYTTYRVALIAYNENGDSPPSEEGTIAAIACDASLCEDDNPCTADSCDGAVCSNVPLAHGTSCPDGMCVDGRCEAIGCRSDAECDDGDLCNGTEQCASDGLCLSGAPLHCGEPTACTAPACDPVWGCTSESVADGTSCPDGMCVAGRCEAIGCRADAECDDGDLCNGTEQCASDGLCLSGAPLHCGEPTACTAPACDPVWGCTSESVADGTSCPDGMCVAGRCEAIGCRADAECDDGDVCNGVEQCASDGLCLSGAPLECGEPSACTAPSCDPVWGCTTAFVPDGTRCDDGIKSTKGDTCVAGSCVGGSRRGNGFGRRKNR